MTIRIGYLAPILLIALPLAACDKDNPFEKALTTLNGGTPVPGGPSAPVVSVAYVAAPVEPAAVAPQDPANCIVPAQLFRSMQCDEQGNLIPIR